MQFEVTVPTVADRVAQMVVKQVVERTVEPIYMPDSYGYRPNKSALDAIGVTRERCWKYDWVLVSLIDCYVVQLSQVFMLRVFPAHAHA